MTVADNIDKTDHKDACPEIVSMGISATSEELLISRSRAMALLYKTMKTAYLENDVKKSNFGKKKYKDCVGAQQIVDIYLKAIKNDKYLKETSIQYGNDYKRWRLWDIKLSNDWKKDLIEEKKILETEDVNLYFCSQGSDTNDLNKVVYHLNFGIPLSDLHNNNFFYHLSEGNGYTNESQNEWKKARERATKCTACVKKNYKPYIAPPSEFYTYLKGAITYLYYGYYHNLDFVKRKKFNDKDSHMNLIKAKIWEITKLLANRGSGFPNDAVKDYENAALEFCSKECVKDDAENATKKYTQLRTLWECRLFYEQHKKKCGNKKAPYPFDSIGTGKPLPVYWDEIEAGSFGSVEWKKRKALIIVVENRDSVREPHESAKKIRDAFQPTTDPDAAETNVKNGMVNLLKLQLGATDK
ncbi:MAG: hypothetical protein GY754_10380 [bacterium]|nr:hypothetical protein [bacterium]